MKAKRTLLSALVALLLSTSCLSGGSSHGGSSSTTEVGYYTSYALNDSGEGTPVYTNNKRISVGLMIPNILTPIMEITLYGVQFDGTTAPQTLLFTNLDFKTTTTDEGLNYVIDAKDITPMVGGVEYPDYKVKYLKASVGTNVVIDLEFETLSKRVIFHSERWDNVPMVYEGKIVVTNTASTTSEESVDNLVTVSKKGTDTQSLEVTFNGVSFAEGMPPLNITFPTLAFKRLVNTNGIIYSIAAEDVIPKIGDTEYPDYEVKYINAEIGNPVTIEFEMAQRPYKVTFTTDTNQ